MAFGNIAIVFCGLALGGPTGISLNTILLLFVLVLLRLKFWFDDEQYIQDVLSGKLPAGKQYYAGISVAVLSWVIWNLPAFFIKNLELSGILMALVIALSTIWVLATMVHRTSYSEQIPWLIFNVFYLIGFLLIKFRGRLPTAISKHEEGFTTGVLCGLLAVFFVDF